MNLSMKIFALLSLGAPGLASCKSRKLNESLHQDTNTRTYEINFCNPQMGQTLLWDAQRVQQEIQQLLNQKEYTSSGLSVYAEVYLMMTQQRDKARCDPSNKMYPPDELTRKLNDALADIMTKALVTSQRVCLQTYADQSVVVPTIGKQLCELGHEAISKHWSSVEFAMGSTAIYLSSIMGMSLSALPHADILWTNTPYTSLQGRIGFMKQKFRPVFDAFNLFLSDNLHTVADVLVQNKRVDCGLFNTVAHLAQMTRAPSLVFKNIRDKTFELGLELSLAWTQGLHPFTVGENTWNVERIFPKFILEPDAITALQKHGSASVTLLKNPLLKIFKNSDAATYVSERGLTCP